MLNDPMARSTVALLVCFTALQALVGLAQATRTEVDISMSDGVVLKAVVPARALLIAGKPLGEPIAQYGPFVMNTNDEIFQAVQDYQSGKFVATT